MTLNITDDEISAEALLAVALQNGLEVGALDIVGDIELSNYGQDPATDGDIAMNGTDVKVHSGGEVRNLSLAGAERVDTGGAMRQVNDGDTDAEMARFSCPSGEAFTCESIQFAQQGGGTEDTNVTLEVYDATNGTVLTSVNLNAGRAEPSVSSPEGVTVTVRWTNSSGTNYNADPTVRGYIN